MGTQPQDALNDSFHGGRGYTGGKRMLYIVAFAKYIGEGFKNTGVTAEQRNLCYRLQLLCDVLSFGVGGPES